MSDGEGTIIQEEPLSDDNTSNTASLGSRVSGDNQLQFFLVQSIYVGLSFQFILYLYT